nr:hypothetical protein Iba_chr08aCG5070 [Ipomoea batatas]
MSTSRSKWSYLQKIFGNAYTDLYGGAYTGLDITLDFAIEASKRVVAGDVGVLLLLDIVLVVLLTDRVNAGEKIESLSLSMKECADQERPPRCIDGILSTAPAILGKEDGVYSKCFGIQAG